MTCLKLLVCMLSTVFMYFTTLLYERMDLEYSIVKLVLALVAVCFTITMK